MTPAVPCVRSSRTGTRLTTLPQLAEFGMPAANGAGRVKGGFERDKQGKEEDTSGDTAHENEPRIDPPSRPLCQEVCDKANSGTKDRGRDRQ